MHRQEEEMAALKPDQLEIDADGASTRIDRNEFGVTAYRGLAARYLDISVEVRCVRS